MKKYEEDISDEDAKILFKWVDKDGDERIDIDDFMKMFMAL